jgi:DNA-binding transcriptional LysR family regulator
LVLYLELYEYSIEITNTSFIIYISLKSYESIKERNQIHMNNFLHLKYFQAVAKHEHITKAAQELNISQPALSNTIARLEESLGIELFIRQGRNIRLNSFGKAYLRRVNKAFFELEKGKREVEEMASTDKGTISFATTLPSILPFLLKDFLELYPNAKFIQSQAFTEKEIIKQLENQEIDICISTFPIINPEIEWLPLVDEEILLSVPSDHRLADRKSIHLKEVANEPFISITPEYYFREMTDNFCRQAGFEPSIVYQISEAGIIQGLVELNLGVTFTPLYLAKYVKLRSVQLHIEEPTCKRSIGLAWHKGHFISRTVEQFIEFCKKFFSESL